MKMRCNACRIKFPGHLVQPLVVITKGGEKREWMCPLCALKAGNMMMGIDRQDFSEGSHAQSMLQAAREYLGSR